MELSVFGVFNAQSAAARDLHKGSEADSNGSGFTDALSECMQSDGSAAPEAQGGGGIKADRPKDASPTPGRFHNMRKKPCEDAGQDNGLDPEAPLRDEEPLAGAMSVKNGDPLPAAGLSISGGRRPVEPEARGIDRGGEDARSASIIANANPLPAAGLSISGGRRPVEPEARGIDRGGKDARSASIIANANPLPAAGLSISGGRRPVEPEARGIDRGGKDARSASCLSPMPLYANGAAVKDASSSPDEAPLEGAASVKNIGVNKAALSAPTISSDTALSPTGSSSGDETVGHRPPAGPVEKPASGPAESVYREAVAKDTVAAAFTAGAAEGADAKINISSAVSVNTGAVASAASEQAAKAETEVKADGGDDGGAKSRAVRGGVTGSERHGVGSPGVLKDTQTTGGAEPVRLDAAKGIDAAAQAGASGQEGSGQGDGNGLEGEGGLKTRLVKDAGPSGTAAFTVDNPLDKTTFDPSKNTDTRTHDVAANNDIYDRLDSGLNIAVTRGAKEISISLHPEHLGAIHIKLSMEGPSSNVVSARITVDSMEVKGFLDADAGALKEAFSRQGLKLDGYTIDLVKNAFGADGGDSYRSNGAGAWGGGGTGGFRDGPSYQGQGTGGWAARDGEIKEGVHNVSTPRSAWQGAGGSSGVDLFA